MGGWLDVLFVELFVVLYVLGIFMLIEMYFIFWWCVCIIVVYYGLGWCVFIYGGEMMIFYVGVVEGYCIMIGFLFKYYIGIVMMWNLVGVMFFGLMLMMFDCLFVLLYVDWVGLESLFKFVGKLVWKCLCVKWICYC